MERPQNVPAEAVFNNVTNEWELGVTNEQDKKIGEWKYWYAITGNFSGYSFLDQTINTLSFVVYHPDGTYAQRGTLVNDVLEGRLYCQKSENETPLAVLTDPEQVNIFRGTGDVVNGEVVWWQYFNKNDEPISVYGNVGITIEQFSANFPDHEIAYELVALLSFEQRYGAECYAQGFSLSTNSYAVSSYSENEEFLKRLMTFASANGSGSAYALWDNGTGKALNEMPVIVFGDEGGVHVVAKNILELMHLLTFDSEVWVDHAGASFGGGFLEPDSDGEEAEDDESEADENDEDDDELEPSFYTEHYKDWLRNSFGLDRVTNPDRIVKAAQEEYKASFDAWFKQYYNAG